MSKTAAELFADRPSFGRRHSSPDASVDQLRARMARCDRSTLAGAALYRCMETMLREKLDAIGERELTAKPRGARRFFTRNR
jgi:hypothetical protein